MTRTPEPPRVIMYTKPNCPLCDEAEDVILRTIGQRHVTFEKVDITHDKTLWEAYAHHIPVVAVNDTPLFYGKVSAYRLNNVLKGETISTRYRRFLQRLPSLFGRR